jgi:hypothetical protein
MDITLPMFIQQKFGHAERDDTGTKLKDISNFTPDSEFAYDT